MVSLIVAPGEVSLTEHGLEGVHGSGHAERAAAGVGEGVEQAAIDLLAALESATIARVYRAFCGVFSTHFCVAPIDIAR
jgi:hypothetical protein